MFLLFLIIMKILKCLEIHLIFLKLIHVPWIILFFWRWKNTRWIAKKKLRGCWNNITPNLNLLIIQYINSNKDNLNLKSVILTSVPEIWCLSWLKSMSIWIKSSLQLLIVTHLFHRPMLIKLKLIYRLTMIKDITLFTSHLSFSPKMKNK